MRVGEVAEIRRYPVKSMAGERLERVRIGEHGLAGDRGYALFDPGERKTISASSVARHPRMLDCRPRYVAAVEPEASLPAVEIALADGGVVRSDDPECAQRLSEFFGSPVDLAAIDARSTSLPTAPKYAMAGTFFDYAPLHLLSDGSLRSIGADEVDSDFSIDRFRPNLVVRLDTSSEFPENDWVGKRMRIGSEISLDLTDPCARCSMTNLSQGELPADAGILKTIVRRNRLYTPFMGSEQPALGVYAFVRRGGNLSVGDLLLLE